MVLGFPAEGTQLGQCQFDRVASLSAARGKKRGEKHMYLGYQVMCPTFIAVIIARYFA